MLMKDSTAVSNQWCMPVNFLGGAIIFDPWFTEYKVKGQTVEICLKKSNKIIEIKWIKISLNLVKGLV